MESRAPMYDDRIGHIAPGAGGKNRPDAVALVFGPRSLWHFVSLPSKMTLPKVLICGKSPICVFVLLIMIGAGDIVWAKKDVDEMLGSITEVVVRSVRHHQIFFR